MTTTCLNTILATGLVVIVSGCGGGVQNHNPAGSSPTDATADVVAAALDGTGASLVASAAAGQCEPVGSACLFERGVTTCARIVAQHATLVERTVYSLCAIAGTTMPGRRTQIYEDRLVTTTLDVTRAHGRCGPVFESTTTEVQQVSTSILVSDTCAPY